MHFYDFSRWSTSFIDTQSSLKLIFPLRITYSCIKVCAKLKQHFQIQQINLLTSTNYGIILSDCIIDRRMENSLILWKIYITYNGNVSIKYFDMGRLRPHPHDYDFEPAGHFISDPDFNL